jgi:predicted ATP-grasp superfamily ATP-dependent carboligase
VDALVADAHHPNSVAGIRALGRAGVRVVALGPERLSAGRWSRFAAGRERGDLAAAAARRGPVVVYPGHEPTIDELLVLRAEPGVVLPWNPDSLAALRTKRALPALAAGHGLAPPATLFDGTAAELPAADPSLPAVVKPAAGVGELPTARVVRSRSELLELAAGLPPDEPVLAQELVRGRLLSLALVLDRDGRVVARFQEEATRTWPLDAGSFAATVSVEPDEGLVDAAGAMLARAGYWGLAQLDLVRAGSATQLLDVNPRFYFCMPLALACGVNLPAAWHAVVEGRPSGSPGAYPTGVRYRWLAGDLYAARHGHPARLFRPGPRAAAHTMWAADDPLGSALLALETVTRPARRRLWRRGGGR